MRMMHGDYFSNLAFQFNYSIFQCLRVIRAGAPAEKISIRTSIAKSTSFSSTHRTPKKVYKHRDRSRRKRPKRSYHRRSDHESSYSSPSSRSLLSSSSQSSSVSYSTRQRRKTPHFKYRVGETIGHRYRITRLLGTGTFGRVLEARYDGNLYAIKVTFWQVR